MFNLKANFTKLAFLLFFASIALVGLGQGPASIWYFGTKAGLQFPGGTGNPTKLTNSAMNLGNYNGEGMASICDNSGNLLFYTDGVTVYGANHVMVTNGNGLNGNTSSTQTALIVPVPGAKNAALEYTRYYIFSTPGEEASAASGTGTANALNGVRYSIMDVTTNSITVKNTLLTPAGVPFTEAQTAVPHYDGTSFWLVCKQAGDRTNDAVSSNTFYSYRIGTSNINATTGVINAINGTANEVITTGQGRSIAGIESPPATIASSNGIITMKVNSCFTKIAVAYFSIAKEVQIFNFNNNTGAITLSTTITGFAAGDPNEVYGLEFSPDGSRVYASVMFFSSSIEAVRGKIYQFNTTSGALTQTHTVAGVTSNGLGALQLGEDGRIYYAHYDNNPTGGGTPTTHVGRIEDPNTSGTAVFTDDYMAWSNSGADAGAAVKMGLPQVYRGFLAGTANITSTLNNLEEICLGDWVDFTASTLLPVVSYSWHIDKNLNSVVDYVTGPTINHLYSATGTYTVEVTVRDACGYDNISTSQVKVLPKINAAGTVSCGPPVTGTVTSPNAAYKYVWYATSTPSGAMATGTSVTLPVGISGNVYLRAESTVTPSTTSPTYFPTALDNNPRAATNNTMPFTVNTPITLTGFTWETSEINWGTNPTNRTFTISIRDGSGTTTLWTNTRVVNVYGALQTNSESFSLALPAGSYQIYINSPASTYPNSIPSWVTQYTMPYTPSSAVTFPANGAIPVFVQNFTFNSTTYATTPLACSQVSAAIPFNCPLPVSWLTFTGKQVASGNQLNWMTASELNTSHFDVERSFDGVNFDFVGRVKAAGNSTQTISYEYVDANEAVGTVYYRLKQVDIDGRYDYSRTIVVTNSSTLSYTLLPNPGDGVVYLTGGDDATVVVNVLDVQGRTVKANVSATAGSSLDLTGLSKGVYLVQVIGQGSVQTLRYVLQ